MVRRALIVCPGRGSYNRDSLGSLNGLEGSTAVAAFDALRASVGRQTVSQMDAAPRFSPALHLAGENASSLTAAISLADLEQLNPDTIQPVAVCGNSMGWYTALAYAGGLPIEDAARLIETMGQYQADNVIGGQIVYPVVDDAWRPDPRRVAMVDDAVRQTPGLHWSIRLGGQAVLGGTADAIAAAPLPPIEGRYTFPLRLPMHSAFHTPLLQKTARRAQQALADLRFQAPRLPLIDGMGKVWRPIFADPLEMLDYTLGAQVVMPYDFTTMLKTALREYAPDLIVLPGPGDSLGGAIGQTLVAEGWMGITDREAFIDRQRSEPILISMRRDEQ
ncbi:MAG: ACP S-malonyltransferase, partial [Myxococcota bacterium]